MTTFTITLPPMEQLVAALAAIGTASGLVFKKFKDYNSSHNAAVKKEHLDLMNHVRQEKEDAVKAKREAVEKLQEQMNLNAKLEYELFKVRAEIGMMQSRIRILSELNNRLSQSLTQARNEIHGLIEPSEVLPLQTMTVELDDADTLPAPLPRFPE